MLRVASGSGISVAANHVGKIHLLDAPFAELLRLMERVAAAFRAVRRKTTPRMLAGMVRTNGLDGTGEYRRHGIQIRKRPTARASSRWIKWVVLESGLRPAPSWRL